MRLSEMFDDEFDLDNEKAAQRRNQRVKLRSELAMRELSRLEVRNRTEFFILDYDTNGDREGDYAQTYLLDPHHWYKITVTYQKRRLAKTEFFVHSKNLVLLKQIHRLITEWVAGQPDGEQMEVTPQRLPKLF